MTYAFLSEPIGCSFDVCTNAFEIGQILNAFFSCNETRHNGCVSHLSDEPSCFHDDAHFRWIFLVTQTSVSLRAASCR